MSGLGAAGSTRPSTGARAPTPDDSFGLAPRPFNGLRVLDFGIGGVGVECSRILGLLGADVVKVESAAAPDFQRVVLGGLMNGAFASSSRSKRGLGLDLSRPEGVAFLHRLAAVADVVVENRGTGALDRLGIGWEALHAVNPRLVMISSQLMGDHGAWANWKGYGPITRAVGGIAWLWNHPEDADDPQGVTTIHPDHQAGRWMALLAAALLLRRARTGLGGHADVAQVEVIVGQLGDLLAAESVTPGSVRPTGNQGPDAPWGVFRCADRPAGESPTPAAAQDWVAVSVRDDADWRRLAAVVDAARDGRPRPRRPPPGASRAEPSWRSGSARGPRRRPPRPSPAGSRPPACPWRGCSTRARSPTTSTSGRATSSSSSTSPASGP